MTYQVEYLSQYVGYGWLKAGHPIDGDALIADYRAHREKYRDGTRRAFKLTQKAVTFAENIIIKETN